LKQRNEEALQVTPDAENSFLWYHGSPAVLNTIRAGSTITLSRTLAMAFSHKPVHVQVDVNEHTEIGLKTVTITQDGSEMGFLYSVEVSDPNRDTREDPESVMFPRDEVLTTRELKVKLIKEVPLRSVYTFTVKE
jgi:hypothetical protein